MTENNKTSGNRFEREFCAMMRDNGFWSHNMVPTRAGQQPADIITVRNGHAYLIDCKVLHGDRFPLSRVEQNQHTAMQLWCEVCHNGQGWFAIKANDEVYMVPYKSIKAYMAAGKSSIPVADMTEVGYRFERWISRCR